MTDRFRDSRPGLTSPAYNAFSITPSDSAGLSRTTRALYVGGSGNAVVVFANGDQVTLAGLLAGVIYPLRLTQVKFTSTTATSLVGLY